MKTRILIFGMCTFAILAPRANAQNPFGVGVIVGEPTGIVIKKWLGSERAFDAAAAWSFSGNTSFQFHADYLFHNFSLLDSEDMKGELPFYYGIGGRIKLRDHRDGNGRNDEDARIGVRAPVGLSYIFSDTPVDLFIEIAPILDLLPATDFSINGAIGARYYFQ